MPTLEMITLEQLLEMKANDQDFTLVDTLAADSYDEGHIPGAVSMPSGSIAGKAADLLDKDEVIVTYCAGYTCDASTIAARKLLDLGYGKTVDFKAGKKGWMNAGFELEK